MAETRYARVVTEDGEDSLSRIARRIPAGSVVLDVGTGPGALARYLVPRGCTFDGIEHSPALAALARSHYRRLAELDLESGDLTGELARGLAGERYDAIVCADVLEHVRDPGRVLDALAPFLRAGGRFLISVPNVGYAGVLAALAGGDFRYGPLGLLDATHVRFFTRRSFLELLAQHGLGAVDLEVVTRPLHDSEFRDGAPEALPAPLREAILSRPDASAYQFVIEAVPGASHAAALAPGEGAVLTFGARLYWRGPREPWNEASTVSVTGAVGVAGQTLRFELPRLTAAPAEVRLDPADRPGFLHVRSIRLLDRHGLARWTWTGEALSLERAATSSELVQLSATAGRWWISTGDDPWLVLPLPPDALASVSEATLCVEVDWPMTWDAYATGRAFSEQVRQWRERFERLEARYAERASAAAALERRVAEQFAALSAVEARAQATELAQRVLAERLEDVQRTPVRRTAMAARRAVAPRTFELAATPVSGLAGSGDRWKTTGDLAWFRLDHRTNRYPAGWVEIDLELEADDGDPVVPILRASAGVGQPDVSVTLPETVAGRSNGIVKLPDRVQGLHLGPIARSTAFRMGAFRVRELSRPVAALRLAAPLVSAYALRPAEGARAVRGGLEALRRGGWTALKRAFRETVTAGARAPRSRARAALEAPVGPRIAFLAVRMMKGYGVEVVVAQQVEHFCARGYDVTVLVLGQDGHYDALLRSYVEAGQLRIVTVASPEDAAREIVARGIDVVVAHTPPLYEALPLLPPSVVRVLFDHGEPPADRFDDAAERRRVAERKVEISRSVDVSVAISRFVQADSGLRAPELCFNGNDHLLRRRSDLARLPGRFRPAVGLRDEFVVLNVTRFGPVERRYKGIEEFAAVQDALLHRRPELRGQVQFVLAGRCEPADLAWARDRGLFVAANVGDEELVSAYLDADLYLTTSRWEGCNLGLAQALAFGVPSLASAQGAHPEFPVRTSDDPAQLAAWVAEEIERSRRSAEPRAPLRRLRHATVLPWRAAAHRVEGLVRAGIDARGGLERPLPPPLSVRPSDGEPPLLSIAILDKDRPELIERCVRSIEEHCDVPYEILIGDTGSTHPRTLRFYETTPHAVHHLGFYNFSACNNILAARARGRYLLFLNNDTEIIRASFREVLDALERDRNIGCIGGYLVYADRTIQHAGVRLCRGPAEYRGIGEHIDRHVPIDGYPGLGAPRDVVAVTGAMLLVSAERFAAAGGFDEVYVEEAQDIDLCLRLRELGLRSVMHPGLLAYHYENSTRTVKECAPDRAEFLRRFQSSFDRELWAWQDAQGL